MHGWHYSKALIVDRKRSPGLSTKGHAQFVHAASKGAGMDAENGCYEHIELDRKPDRCICLVHTLMEV